MISLPLWCRKQKNQQPLCRFFIIIFGKSIKSTTKERLQKKSKEKISLMICRAVFVFIKMREKKRQRLQKASLIKHKYWKSCWRFHFNEQTEILFDSTLTLYRFLFSSLPVIVKTWKMNFHSLWELFSSAARNAVSLHCKLCRKKREKLRWKNAAEKTFYRKKKDFFFQFDAISYGFVCMSCVMKWERWEVY